MRYVYHGRSPSDSGWETSVSGAIRGQQFTIYDVDIPEPDEERDYRAIGLYDLPGDVVGEREVEITGGVTKNIGAAIKFHSSLSEIGAVFIIDRDRLGFALEDIEYTYEWASEHPGTYARIDSIDEFEIYDDGDLVGAGYHRREDGVPIVNKWTDQLRSRIDNFAYADEAELAVYGSGSIDFTSGLFGTASYLHTTKAVGGSVQGALDEHPGYRIGFASGEAEDVTRMTDGERAKAFQRAITDQYGGGVISRSHMVVLYDEKEQSIRDKTRGIRDGAFILATDGRNGVYRDPQSPDVRPYLGG